MKFGDEVIEIFDENNSGAVAPYLNVEAIIGAAKAAGADAIVPGYGCGTYGIHIGSFPPWADSSDLTRVISR